MGDEAPTSGGTTAMGNSKHSLSEQKDKKQHNFKLKWNVQWQNMPESDDNGLLDHSWGSST